MLEINEDSELTSQELAFIELLFSIDSEISLEYKTIKEMSQLLYSEYVTTFRPEDRNRFPLGIWLVRYTQTSHLIMRHFDIKINIDIIFRRNNLLLKLLQLIYKNQYYKEMSSKLYDYLHETLFIATCVNYDPKKLEQMNRDYHLNGAYHNNASLAMLNNKLKIDMNTMTSVLRSHNFIRPESVKRVLDELQNEHNTIVRKYTNTTRAIVSNFSYGSPILLFCICIIAFILEMPYIAGCLALMGGLIVLWNRGTPYHNREMNSKTKKIYSQKLVTWWDELANKTTYQLSPQESNTLHNAVRSKTLALKASSTVWCRFTVLNSRLQFRKINLPGVVNPDKNKKKETKNIHPIDQETIYASSIFTDTKSGHYSYHNLKRKYRKIKGDSKTKQKKRPGVPKPDKKTTTYQNVTFKLSHKQQENGCLVVKDRSMAYFELKSHKNYLTTEQLTKMRNNQFGFGAKTGDFGSFKAVGKKHYELKLFDGKRIIFKQNGNITVSKSDGAKKFVPRYVVIKTGSK